MSYFDLSKITGLRRSFEMRRFAPIEGRIAGLPETIQVKPTYYDKGVLKHLKRKK